MIAVTAPIIASPWPRLAAHRVARGRGAGRTRWPAGRTAGGPDGRHRERHAGDRHREPQRARDERAERAVAQRTGESIERHRAALWQASHEARSQPLGVVGSEMIRRMSEV